MAPAEHVVSSLDAPQRTIEPVATFQATLEREFVFSSRGELRFAVAEYAIDGDRSEPPLLERLAASLRQDDVVGWLSPGSLGVLMRDTGLAAARERAAEIARAVDAVKPPRCTLYAFPPPGVAGQGA